MRQEERLAILGAATVAEIQRRVDAAPIPPPDSLEKLRHILAPALERVRAQRTAVDAGVQQGRVTA